MDVLKSRGDARRFVTSRGLLTSYAFACGYHEIHGSLILDMPSPSAGTYRVRGVIDRYFKTIKEARDAISIERLIHD